MGFLTLAGGAQQCDAAVGERGLELLAVVVFVRDQVLAGMRRQQGRVGGEHAQQGLAFVGLGAGERERDRQPARGAQQVQPQAPEVP